MRLAVLAASFAMSWMFAGVALAEPAPPTGGAAKPDRGTAAKPTKPERPRDGALTGAPLRAVIVRSAVAGCEPDCREWIAAEGAIVPGSLAQFKKVFAQMGQRQLPIMIHSPGGSVDEALAIGRAIRARKLDVFVTRTALQGCPQADPACRKAKAGEVRGVPVERAVCASSCAFVLAAGTRRLVGDRAVVGVHKIAREVTTVRRTYRVLMRPGTLFSPPTVLRRELVSERPVSSSKVEAKSSDSTYGRIAKYFAEMGVGGNIMAIILETPNSQVHVMTADELRSTGMMTGRLDGAVWAGARMPPQSARTADDRPSISVVPPPVAVEPRTEQPNGAARP